MPIEQDLMPNPAAEWLSEKIWEQLNRIPGISGLDKGVLFSSVYTLVGRMWHRTAQANESALSFS